uniref:Uncharacterized protein n=1 Tax=Arundo donax TaxID=35708 RepID=A0A0A9FY86_ARUDO
MGNCLNILKSIFGCKERLDRISHMDVIFNFEMDHYGGVLMSGLKNKCIHIACLVLIYLARSIRGIFLWPELATSYFYGT